VLLALIANIIVIYRTRLVDRLHRT